MPITRKFLDWSRPALPAVAEFLAEQFTTGDQADLSGVIVVLPGRRACRRLLELLVEQTQSRLVPPRIITEGQFPELLYEPQRPFASQLIQQLAWGEAVRRLPQQQAQQVVRDLPDDGDVDGWMALGELLWKLHRELAADQLDFGDVVREGQQLSGFGERRRWEALYAAQQEYLAIIDGQGLWDRQTARLVAIDQRECRTDRQIYLVGTVDLNRTTRAMLAQVAESVTALIHAPDSVEHRFDEYGCIRPEAWGEAPIELDDGQLQIAEGPAEQGDEVVRILSAFDGRYRADDITIGVADESLVPQLQRRLTQYDVPCRWVVGKTLPETQTVQLLSAVADYLENRRPHQFAALVRHPAIDVWLRSQGVAGDWLSELDAYCTSYLPGRLGYWLGHPEGYPGIRRVYDLLSEWMSEIAAGSRPLEEWSPAILQLPLTIFEPRQFDPEKLNDLAEIKAFTALQNALQEYAGLPESLAPAVSGAQAIRLTLEQLESDAVPPPRDDTAVELLGWLELPLDDAPVLVVTSFNEGHVPSSMDADLFLPNRLRQHLGIIDNERRYARDAYALSAMLASREQLVLIAGRRDRRGDPLLPSRLALACDPESIAGRIEAYFDSKDVPRPLPAFGGDVNLDQLPQEGLRLIVPQPQPLEEPKNRLSITSFRDYLQCPYRYYLRHVLQLAAVDDEVEELSSLDFGNLLHEALADFGRSELSTSTDAEAIARDLEERFRELVRRNFGSWRLPAVNVQIEQGISRLQAFALWQAQWAADGWSIAFVEQPEDRNGVPYPIDGDRTVWLRGRIDRIDRHEDGRWAIFDYKSGEGGDPPEKTHRRSGEWIDLQLPLYRWLAQHIGVSGDITLGYIVLPGDSTKVDAPVAKWSAEELAEAEAVAREVAGQILDETFWPPAAADSTMLSEFAAICQEGVIDVRPAE